MVILISGGSDGLGKEIARLLSPKNQVIILAPNAEKTAAAAAQLNCDFVTADVSENNRVEKAVAQVVKKYQRIDVLVNCAGVWIEGPLEANGAEAIAKTFKVNTCGTIFLCRAVLPLMKKQKSGRIINIISQSGLYGKAERTIYNASKWAVTGFTKSLEMEVAKDNIGVAGLYPGAMQTPMYEKAGIAKNLDRALSPAEVARCVEFILSLPTTVNVPELGIKSVSY